MAVDELSQVGRLAIDTGAVAVARLVQKDSSLVMMTLIQVLGVMGVTPVAAAD
jgi:hypothetical protein